MNELNPNGQHARRRKRYAYILPTVGLNQALADKLARLRSERDETIACLLRRLIADAPEPKA